MFIQFRKFLKRIFSITFGIILCMQLVAQAPLSFNYQAVLRNASGEVLANQDAEIGIAILQGSASGAEVFSETHSVTTNNFGLANLQIGSINPAGMESIDWSAGPYFIQVSVDGTVMGASQLLSVPFALHAITVENDNVEDSDSDPENEIQDISLSGNELSITQGSTVTLPLDEVDDADADPSNEIQILSISGDTIFLTNGGYVKLPSGFDGHYSSLSGTPQNLSEFTNDGGFITSPYDADADPTNELQDILLTGQELTITGGSSVLLPDEVNDADADPTNELQDISLSGTDLSITDGSTVDLSVIQDGTGTDNQRLSLGMNNQGKMRLNISDGNYVDMPFVKDGTDEFQWAGNSNYTAKWAGNGSIVKGSVYDNGNIGIGTNTPGAKLEVAGQVKITGGTPALGRVLTSDADGLASWETIPAETDPIYSADSAYIKSGIRDWDNSLAKQITTIDTTRWGQDADPANELQVLSISNDTIFLSNDGFVKLPAETDPVYLADSAYIKSGVRDWGNSLAKQITTTDTTRWGQDADPTNEIQDIGEVLSHGNDAGAEGLVNLGNVGIGTTTPDYALQVNGDVVPETDGNRNLGSPTLGWDTLFMSSTIDYKNNLGFTSGGNEKVTFTTDGQIKNIANPTSAQDAATKSYVDKLKTDINERIDSIFFALYGSIQQKLDYGISPFTIYHTDGFPREFLYGKQYQGGIIFYIDETEPWGLVAAPSDQSSWKKWCNYIEGEDDYYVETGATGTDIGTGLSNTNAIINVQGIGDYAAQLCDNLVLNGYSDWFFPSIGELNAMYNNLFLDGYGDFVSGGDYWSSTELGSGVAQFLDFSDGGIKNGTKLVSLRVRAIRKIIME